MAIFIKTRSSAVPKRIMEMCELFDKGRKLMKAVRPSADKSG